MENQIVETTKTNLIGETIKRYFRNNYKIILSCFFVGLVTMIFGIFLCDKGMVPTEGWYSYYAYMINVEHAVPYVDFELLFPPLYVYCIALFTKIFGYNIIALRVLGILIYITLAILSCLIFYLVLDNELVAGACGVLVFAFLQSEIAQISYDYIRFMDVSVYFSIFALLKILKKKRPDEEAKVTFLNSISPSLVFGGLFASFASLFKQSSGLIYLLFAGVFLFCVFLVIKEKNAKKQALFQFLWYLLIVTFVYLIMFAFLLCQGALGKYFYYNFKASTGAKGGVFTILFGNAIASIPTILRDSPLVLFFGLIIGATFFLSKFYFDDKENKMLNTLLIVVFGILSIIIIFIVFKSLWFGMLLAYVYPTFFMYCSFLLNFIITCIVFVCVIVYKTEFLGGEQSAIRILFLSSTAFVLAYAVCMSGSLCQSQVALCVGISFASTTFFLKFAGKNTLRTALVCVMCIVSMSCFAYKLRIVYSWWGLDAGTFWEQTVKIDEDVPFVGGLKVNEDYAETYKLVNDAIKQNSTKDDNVFIFPHVPIFYLTSDRSSTTYTKVQWFDVSVDNDVLADVEKIREQPPKVIVIAQIPQNVIDSHESLFRNNEKSGLSAMQEFLLDFVDEKGYSNVVSQPLSGEYTISVYVLE